MKALRGTWDFFFGTFLIAGAPFCGIFLVGTPLDFIYTRWLKYDDNKFHAFYVWGGILPWLAAAAAFVYAVQYRAKHRSINRGFLPIEIIFALIAAFLFLMLLGVLLYPG